MPTTLTYAVPEGMLVTVGSRVWVRCGGRSVEGLVFGEATTIVDNPRPIERIIDGPGPTPDLVELGRWIADYYLAPPGEVARLLVPSGGRAREAQRVVLTDRGQRAAEGLGQALESPLLDGVSLRERAVLERLLQAEGEAKVSSLGAGASRVLKTLEGRGLVERNTEVKVRRERASDPFTAIAITRDEAPSLTAEQLRVLAVLLPSLERRDFAPFLLHGITGSGKTEIYLHAIAVALERGRGALVLVPEISLTPQLASRFRARFGDQVAVLHSGLTDRARFDAWVGLQAGRMRIALGARSAVFAPIPQLGVVVVDEEHDGSFKQEEGVRYHGRDVALVRARSAGALAILGSATPSLETYAAARAGRIHRLELVERPTGRPLPRVEVVDLRQHRIRADEGLLSAPLVRAIDETLAAREQVLLFLNRRGFATFLLCRVCGHRMSCPDCAVTLTYHRRGERLACHYCGHLEPVPAHCLRCQASAIEQFGMGTERLEQRVVERFPHARVARLDRDSAYGRGLERVLDGLRVGEIDLVVGTQMIAKGHDFPRVTLVGVVLADQGMGLPDFRATERTFQLLEQVAGRAGRGERPGRVLIQTYNPEHLGVLCARAHDYLRFFESERAAREELNYPPFCRLGIVRFDGPDGGAVRHAATEVALRLRGLAARAPIEAAISVVGPAEAPLARLKGRTRWQILVKASQPTPLRTMLLAARTKSLRGVRILLDVDPVSMM